MPALTDHAAFPVPGRSFLLAGPSERSCAGALPVRGDLAHIALAGKVFVPHYAAPMPHRATQPLVVRSAPREDADAVQALGPGAPFDVLDIAGGWAWGMCADAESGPAGYAPLALLECCG